MRLFTKLIVATCGLTGGGFLFDYLTNSQTPIKRKEVKKEEPKKIDLKTRYPNPDRSGEHTWGDI